MTNDNDVLLLLSSQNNGTYGVYIDSKGYKTLTPQTAKYEAKYMEPYVCYHGTSGLLAGKDPKKVIFPNCSKASGFSNSNSTAFMVAFQKCTSLTSVSFPSLTTATGGEYWGAFASAFDSCTSLTSVSFPSLKTATSGSKYASTSSSGAFGYAFYGCTSLTSVSFPSLTTVIRPTIITGATFYQAFNKCSPSLKVHFKKSMKGTAGLDYETMGLQSSSQVVFDLQ